MRSVLWVWLTEKGDDGMRNTVRGGLQGVDFFHNEVPLEGFDAGRPEF